MSVTRFQPGDEVFASTHRALAEFVCVAETGIAPKPSNLTFEPVGTVSVAGFGTRGNHTVASRAFAALGELGVPVLAVTQAALEDSASFCVRESAVPDTIRLLHRALGLEPCEAS